MSARRINRDLPNAKARAVALVGRRRQRPGPLEERTATVDKLIADNRAGRGPRRKAEARSAVRQGDEGDTADSTFAAKGMTWKSFPNHLGHRDTPGCFRCHDGKHFNDKGEAIRLQCTLCHNLPQVKLENGGGSVASTIVQGVSPPDSHSEPNFMHEHRLKLDKSLRDVSRRAQVRAGRRQLLLQPGVPRPHLARAQPERRVDATERDAGGGGAPANGEPKAAKK